MASAKTAFRDYLVADTTIQGFVGADPGAKVYPFVAPPNASLPYIIYQRISAQRGHNYSSANGITTQRYQVDVYAADALTVESMADAIRERCDGFRGLMGTPNLDVRHMRLDDEDDRLALPNTGSEVVTHRIRQDIFITYAESVPTFP